MADFQIKVGDLLPSLSLTLVGADDLPISLVGATAVRLRMWKPHTPGARAYVVNTAPVVVDAPTGQLRYDWVAGNTDVVGPFAVDVVVTWPTNRPQTFPTIGWVTVEVVDEGLGSW